MSLPPPMSPVYTANPHTAQPLYYGSSTDVVRLPRDAGASHRTTSELKLRRKVSGHLRDFLLALDRDPDDEDDVEAERFLFALERDLDSVFLPLPFSFSLSLVLSPSSWLAP